MLRALLTLIAVGGAFTAGVFAGPYVLSAMGRPALGPSPVPAIGPVAKPAAPSRPGAQQSCRDECEQRAIVYHLPDSAMLSCISHCPFDPAAPRETPRSISVAPSDHRK